MCQRLGGCNPVCQTIRCGLRLPDEYGKQAGYSVKRRRHHTPTLAPITSGRGVTWQSWGWAQ